MNNKNLKLLSFGIVCLSSAPVFAQDQTVLGDLSVEGSITLDYEIIIPRSVGTLGGTYFTGEGIYSDLPLNFAIDGGNGFLSQIRLAGDVFQIWTHNEEPTPDQIWFKISKVGSAFVPGGESVTNVASPNKLVMTNSSGKIDGGLLDLSGASFVTPQFQIASGNTFTLFSPGTSTAAVVLNPVGTSAFAGNVTLGSGSLNVIDGNVGIGVGTPTAKLQVAGNLRIGSSLSNNEIRFYGTSEDGDGAFSDTVIAERLYAGSDRSELLFFKGNDLDSSLSPSIAWGDRIRFDTPGSIVFQTGGGYRSYAPTVEGSTVMTINSAGRILVGTTVDDGGNKLQVSGNVKVNGKVRVPPSGDLSMGSFTAGANPAL